MVKNQDMQSLKMSRGHSQVMRDMTLNLFSDVLSESEQKNKLVQYIDLRMVGTKQDLSWERTSPLPGEPSMPNTGESPKEENVSLLSEILMDTVLVKYYLSPKACLGILRRASERGKELPPLLKKALERQARSV